MEAETVSALEAAAVLEVESVPEEWASALEADKAQLGHAWLVEAVPARSMSPAPLQPRDAIKVRHQHC